MVILTTLVISYLLEELLAESLSWITFLIIPFLVLGIAFTLTMIRFWRTPRRKISANENHIVSPADGNILYIKRIEKGEVPVAIKKGLEARLDEIAGTDILNFPGWLIGINMTPFDVHKNCAPIEGEIVLNKHINGQFLSLKHPSALISNERNTLVIKNDRFIVGVVQTASRLVRRIDSYVKEGDMIKKGEWFGMIRFGSQVDVILPAEISVNIKVGDQVYAGKTILAKAKT
jgi:phosphatidylserine decarboxylase